MSSRLKRENVIAIEVFLTSLSLWWGLALLLPVDTFGTSESYQAMSNIANEGFWSFIMFCLTMIHIFGMSFNNKQIKQIGLLIATCVWIFVGTMFGWVDVLHIISNEKSTFTTASGTYILIGMLSGWLYGKVGGQ